MKLFTPLKSWMFYFCYSIWNIDRSKCWLPNAPAPISLRCWGNFAYWSCLQQQKAWSSIFLTPFGMFIDRSAVNLYSDFSRIISKDFGNRIDWIVDLSIPQECLNAVLFFLHFVCLFVCLLMTAWFHFFVIYYVCIQYVCVKKRRELNT